MDVLPWPIDHLPRIIVAGRFPLGDRWFETAYRGPTHALHLHDYPGEVELGDARLALRPGDATLSLAPGEHYFCGDLTLTGNGKITGTDVALVFAPGSAADFGVKRHTKLITPVML